jgi:hypothetical protein
MAAKLKIEKRGDEMLMEVGITGHKFGSGPSKDHSTKV